MVAILAAGTLLITSSSSTIVTCSNPFCSIAIDFDYIWMREHADLVVIVMIICYEVEGSFMMIMIM